MSISNFKQTLIAGTNSKITNVILIHLKETNASAYTNAYPRLKSKSVFKLLLVRLLVFYLWLDLGEN